SEWDVITLKGKDSVVGLALPQDIDDSLAVFVTSNAQLLAFDAAGLRAQGWNASGVAGIKVAAEAQVIFFGMTPKAAKTDEEGDADAELGSFAVVTIATGENFYGAPSSSIKVSEFSEFPTKGRATSGVRAHKFLKGETELSLAWVGDSPQAAAAAGAAPACERRARRPWRAPPCGRGRPPPRPPPPRPPAPTPPRRPRPWGGGRRGAGGPGRGGRPPGAPPSANSGWSGGAAL